MTYYSERETYSFPENSENFYSNISKPSYIVLTIYESTPDWVYEEVENQSRYSLDKIYYLIPCFNPIFNNF
jgi:hypothetical protein